MYLRFGENAKAFDLKWFGVLRRVKQNRLHALKLVFKTHADGFYIRAGESVFIISVCLNQLNQFFYSLFFRNVLFNTFLLFVQTDFASSGTYIAIVGIGHFTRAIDDTAHDTDFQSLEVSRSRLDAGDGRFQVVQCTSATRTRDVFGFGSTDTSCLQDTKGGFRPLSGY